MNEIIYILTNESMPGYVKIGRTKDLRRRLKDLYGTPVPLPFECHYACEVENAQETEDWLFRIFKTWRVSKDREFFRISPEGAVEALKVKAIRDVTPKQIYVESKEDRVALEKAKERRGRFNFELAKIPLGAEIYFSRDENKKEGTKVEEMERPKCSFNSSNKALRRIYGSKRRYEGDEEIEEE